MSVQSDFARAAADGGRAVLVTAIGGEAASVGSKLLLIDGDGSPRGTLGTEAIDAAAGTAAREMLATEHSGQREIEGAALFFDVTVPAPRLFILGAVDYSAALCRIARDCGWRPFVCDPRTAFAKPERFPEAERVVEGWPEAAFAELGGLDRGTYLAVLTHDPKLDDAALSVALRSDAAYIGAMGSRRAQERRRERLGELGFGDDDIARIAAPIGLDLGALSPEETALSIMAEMVALRNGREGGRLAATSGRIHEAPA